jgi:hypothetical protein
MRKNTQPYPKADGQRSGVKVGWRYYRDLDAAKACAAAAKHNAQIYAAMGYDFGFCAPGRVTAQLDGEYAGMYSVCIP